jgi:hypothetical protein
MFEQRTGDNGFICSPIQPYRSGSCFPSESIGRPQNAFIQSLLLNRRSKELLLAKICSGNPLLADNVGNTQIVGIIRDITERKRLEGNIVPAIRRMQSLTMACWIQMLTFSRSLSRLKAWRAKLGKRSTHNDQLVFSEAIADCQ